MSHRTINSNKGYDQQEFCPKMTLWYDSGTGLLLTSPISLESAAINAYVAIILGDRNWADNTNPGDIFREQQAIVINLHARGCPLGNDQGNLTPNGYINLRLHFTSE
jgi:hypothetical protein